MGRKDTRIPGGDYSEFITGAKSKQIVIAKKQVITDENWVIDGDNFMRQRRTMR